MSLLTIAFFERAELERDETKPKHLVVAMSSDRGLCGAVHSGVARSIKQAVPEKKAAGADVSIVCIGDKTRAILARYLDWNSFVRAGGIFA